MEKEEINPIILQGNDYQDLKENDYFNTLEKAELIKSFLVNYSVSLKKSKMIALYGEWGSGKTSVLKYIENHFLTKSDKTVFFDTWKYEKDTDLVMSLFEAIFSKAENEGTLNKLKKSMGIVIKSIAKSASINVGGVSFSGKDFIESGERKTENRSYYSEIKDFEKKFEELEDRILGKEEVDKDKRLFVFIDDLDRCEPENITELLSVIKLFFTLGKRTIFICGVDKEAVEKALEVSFKDFGDEGKDDVIELLSEMLESIGFINPRHLKKVINKYMILRFFNTEIKLVKKIEILDKLILKKENTFCIIVFFLMIVLYEFYREEYSILMNYEGKIEKIKEITYKNLKGQLSHEDAIKEKKNQIEEKIERITLDKYEFDLAAIKKVNDDEFCKIITYFLPYPEEDYYYESGYEKYIEQFSKSKSKVLIKFCKYLKLKYETLKESELVKIKEIIKVIELYL